MTQNTIHIPVMLNEVLEYLNPKPNENFIDCTFGGGGHSLAILEKVKPNGKVIGIDWDIKAAASKKKKNLILVNDNYRNLKKVYKSVKNDQRINQINGVLLDLGLSSDQLESGDRGFGFQSKGLLDLRFDKNSQRPTAAEILRSYSERELVDIFKNYGEEPLARPLAKKIIADRRQSQYIETAEMLVQLVSEIYKKKFKSRSRKNPATRVFQALRIAVNDEFGNIRAVLPQAIELLSPGGRLVVVSFHSGEDRIVKHYFKEETKRDNPRIKILTKRPISPTPEEINLNSRSRSAKIRVIEKI